MFIIDSFVNDMYQRIVYEAIILTQMNMKKTLEVRCIQTATKLCLNGELSKVYYSMYTMNQYMHYIYI